MTAVLRSVGLGPRSVAPRRYKDKCPHPIEGEALRAKSQPSRWDVQARKAALEPHFPSHVRACANNQLDAPPWHLYVWETAKPQKQTRLIYTCGSYRCPSPQCQRKAAHTDFARIDKALKTKGLDPSGWVFFVLTIDQKDHFKTAKKPYKNEQEAFKRLSNNTRFFLRRLRRRQATRGERVLDNEWVGTVEIQRNGWPHVNLIVYAPELAEELRNQEPLSEEALKRYNRAQIRDPWLMNAVTETNWGTISTAESVKDSEALAGYIVKLGGEFGRTAGEIAKLTQAPTNAKMKLRRIRAGRGFLPPQRTNQRKGEFTGVMMRRKMSFGVWTAGPMIEPDQVKPKGETEEERREWYDRYAAGVRAAWETERQELREEETLENLIRSGPTGALLAHMVKRKQGRNLRLIT